MGEGYMTFDSDKWRRIVMLFVKLWTKLLPHHHILRCCIVELCFYHKLIFLIINHAYKYMRKIYSHCLKLILLNSHVFKICVEVKGQTKVFLSWWKSLIQRLDIKSQILTGNIFMNIILIIICLIWNWSILHRVKNENC